MLYLLKYFPEISVKSRIVRKQFTLQLRKNIRNVLKVIDPNIVVTREWDCLHVSTEFVDATLLALISTRLSNTPGVALIHEVSIQPLPTLEGIAQRVQQEYADKIIGKTIAVRCKRTGKHAFSSMDVEKFVGAALIQNNQTAGVNLSRPEVTVTLEIREDTLFVVTDTIKGLGGFPLGCQESVVSLISGGFDSSVSSYLCIKRGLQTHYCFFNLGGSAHEATVKEIAVYLWSNYHSSHRVKFISVPFEGVVEAIVTQVDNAYMGVVLKRLMLRAASAVAAKLHIKALVTGDSVAQVSSQTLSNLVAIDTAADALVLRPLITTDKQDIIDTARKIGTEPFSLGVPEYCAVISKGPTTKANPLRLDWEEAKIDPAVLETALSNANYQVITELLGESGTIKTDVKTYEAAPIGSVVIDIRHPDDCDAKPLVLLEPGLKPESKPGLEPQPKIIELPFYKLSAGFGRLDQSQQYLLYCERGSMSRIHAAYLEESGFLNVAVLDLKAKSQA